MLKLQTSSAVLQLSRITLAASLPSTKCNMSTTDGTVRPPPSRAAEHADEYKQTPPARTAAAFFPMGYKDAAYQWVSWLIHIPSCLWSTVTNLPPVVQLEPSKR